MSKGILFRRVSNYQEVPRGYGFVYVDHRCREVIYSPVPLNLLFGLLRAAWLWLLHDYYTTNMAKRERVHTVRKTDRIRAGLLFRLGSFWIGVHWSPIHRRWCINLVPCMTLWLTLPGGDTP